MQIDCRGSQPTERGSALLPLRWLVGAGFLTLVVSILVGTVSLQAQEVPPHEDYRTLRSTHFNVTFPAHLERVGRTAAVRAERAYAALQESFLPPPRSRIDLLVTDHSDFSNGAAHVFPSNRIIVSTQPPLGGLALSHFDEWLELVIVHELSHIFHLDRTGPIGTGVRSVLGRVPWTWPAFPAYTTSFLGIEGVAVHLESTHTRAGRIHGSLHEAVARTQALGRGSESVGQGLGRSPLWPAADRPYVFGSLFYRHLSETYGEPAVVQFLRTMAGQWIPYRLDAAARSTFGRSFDELWVDWLREVEADADSLQSRIDREGRTPPELLTHAGRWALYPAPTHGGVFAYVRSDGRSDSRLVLTTSSGERALSRWNSLEPPRWLSDGSLLVPQAVYLDTYHVARDLFRVTPDGDVTRLTQGLRVVHVDAHPESPQIAAVLAGDEGNRLVVLSLEGEVRRVLREPEAGVLWSHPAWSPDGEKLAVVRRRRGGSSAVLVLDATGSVDRQVTEDRSLNGSPTWSPDGEIVAWSSDRSGVPNIYAAAVGTAAAGAPVVGSPAAGSPRNVEGTSSLQIWQVTDLATGGVFPSIDPSGEWIYLSVLSDDGWEIGRVRYDPASWFDPHPVEPRYLSDGGGPTPGVTEALAAADPPQATSDVGSQTASAEYPTGSYSPFGTIWPRYWLPTRIEAEATLGTEVLPTAWGARTSGADLIGRHEYDLRLAVSPFASRSRTEWGARYAWAGLGNPTLVIETGQDWQSRSARVAFPPGSDPPGSSPPDTLLPIHQERWVGGAVELRRQRFRSSAIVSLGARMISQHRRILELDGVESDRFMLLRPSSSLAELRASAALSTTRSYPFSVSTENGVSFAVGLRQRWDPSVPDSLAGRTGSDGAFREAVVSVRAFRGVPGPGHANHVVALRAAVGLADGPASGTGHFGVGGGGGDGRGVLGLDFAGSRRFPVRGLSPGAERGNKAWAVSGEWRFPLGIVHWGAGSWPVYIDRLAGSLYFDAAGVHREVQPSRPAWHTVGSVGVEIMTIGSLLFEPVDRIRVGVAFPVEGTAGGASAYIQTGWSF